VLTDKKKMFKLDMLKGQGGYILAGKGNMTEQEYTFLFNRLVKEVSELLEVSNNEALVRVVKKKLFDFSDKLRERDIYDETSKQ